MTEGNGQPAPLNIDLFELDSEHEAYASAANDLVMARYASVSEFVRAFAANHLADVASKAGREREFERWERDLDEMVRTAFVLTQAEDWSDLDANKLEDLINACFVRTNALREGVGTDRVERDDFNTWFSILLLGLAHDIEEWDAVGGYLEGRGAFGRIESLWPRYSMVGAHLADIDEKDRGVWDGLNRFAWRDGLFLGALVRTGVLREAEAGDASLAAPDRPLSGELYERDSEAYLQLAGQLTSTTAHRVPEVAKQLYWHLAQPVVEQKLLSNYGRYLQDSFEAAYVLTQAESWAEFDGGEVARMVDEGLRVVIRERDSRDPELLINDPEYRIRNVTYGLIAELEYFTALTEYLDAQPSFERVGGLGAFFTEAMISSGTFKRRHAAKLDEPLRISWHMGIAVGLLDFLGEVPLTMPARL